MTARTYNELFEPQVRLSLVRTPTGWCSVIDQHGSLYFPPTQDIEICLRFMSAMARKKHAVIDDASVERATWTSSGEGPMRPTVPGPAGSSVPVSASVAAHETPPSPDDFSVRVPDNVIPISRGAA